MNALIVYGTTEGHTGDLCRFVADALRAEGAEVRLFEAAQAPPPDGVDACFLAASLHAGYYQAPLVDYARRWADQLSGMRSAFISVSLSAAGENPDDWAGLDQCLGRFLQETQWKPTAVHHAAGAIRFSQYDFFKRLVMKYIARERGMETKSGRDCDLTDYEALREFAVQFALKGTTG